MIVTIRQIVVHNTSLNKTLTPFHLVQISFLWIFGNYIHLQPFLISKQPELITVQIYAEPVSISPGTLCPFKKKGLK